MYIGPSAMEGLFLYKNLKGCCLYNAGSILDLFDFQLETQHTFTAATVNQGNRVEKCRGNHAILSR